MPVFYYEKEKNWLSSHILRINSRTLTVCATTCSLAIYFQLLENVNDIMYISLVCTFLEMSRDYQMIWQAQKHIVCVLVKNESFWFDIFYRVTCLIDGS